MPTRRRSQIARRTPTQAAADARAVEIARQLGRALRDARSGRHATQASVGETAALSPSAVSEAENGHGDDMTLRTWTRLARAAGSDLHAYLERASAAELPRDSVHLRHQELLIRAAIPGGWEGDARGPDR